MYAVISYFNYRKDVSFDILATFHSLERAKEYAVSSCADEDSGRWRDGEVVDSVEKERVYVDAMFKYTTGDGYDRSVFAVIELPLPKDTSNVECLI